MRGDGGTDSEVFDVHFFVPEPRKLKEGLIGLDITDGAANGVVCAGEIAFCFEFDVGDEAEFGTAYI